MSNGTGFKRGAVKKWFGMKSPNRHSDRMKVTIRMVFGSSAVPLKRNIPPETRLSMLPSILREMVKEHLLELRRDPAESIQNTETDWNYNTVVDFGDWRNHYLSAGLDGRYQVREVAHLFSDSDRDRIIPITVHISRSGHALSISAIPLESRSKYCYLSVGDDKTHITHNAALAQPEPSFHRYFGRCQIGNPNGAELVGVDVLTVRDKEVANFDNAFVLEELPVRKKFYRPFVDEHSFTSLLASIKSHITPLAKGHNDQPKLPDAVRLTCVTLESPPVMQDYEGYFMAVYGPCYTKLHDLEGPAYHLFAPFSLLSPPHCTPDVLREEICSKLRAQDSKCALFDADFKDKWELLLWVLPQGSPTNTLHSFNQGILEQFMLPARVAKSDRRLYVEAHVVSTNPLPRVLAAVELVNGELPDFDIGPSSSEASTPQRSTPIAAAGLFSGKLSDSRFEARSSGLSTPPASTEHSANRTDYCIVIMSCYFISHPSVKPVTRYANVLLSGCPDDLRGVMRRHCEDIREKHADKLNQFKGTDYGWHMRSFIRFHDERGQYVNPTPDRSMRFSTMSDLFLTRKELTSEAPTINIDIEFGIVNLGPNQLNFDSVYQLKPRAILNHHRIGTLKSSPLPVAASTSLLHKDSIAEHSRLTYPVLLTYPRTDPDSAYYTDTFARPFHNHLLGSTDDYEPLGNLRGTTVIQKYAQVPEKCRGQLWRWTARSEAAQMKVQPGVPRYPMLTFLHYDRAATSKPVKDRDIKGQVLKLAVRVVNCFTEPHLSEVQVPGDVLLDFEDGKSAIEALSTALKNGLADFRPEYKDLEYGIRFWVLPWAKGLDEDKYSEDIDDLGKLYRWKEGPLKLFLEGEMLANGERRVWLEAHLFRVDVLSPSMDVDVSSEDEQQMSTFTAHFRAPDNVESSLLRVRIEVPNEYDSSGGSGDPDSVISGDSD
ncbi:unnamed protein product [Zymoseptoria tritici ST99CH_3D7]|uniref:Uncharacterized protein n=1 Tax=Zymoseptoria tritici (strain ST99CH_3D7) TaxID=1276538 RepID=A0A1X7RKN1_ZYMT9|nr:unnamed protein product [Zymoseptoria tritici ST99CH_3D7]